MKENKRLKAAVDDNLLAKGEISTAGSKILGNFVPPFEAGVLEKLIEAGINIACRTKPCELGISLSGAFGAVAAVASGSADLGISCDVLGKPGVQAAGEGIFFLKPTYGTVSRFGLVSTAPSLEQIGVAFRNVSDGAAGLTAISGKDPRDGAMASREKYTFDVAASGLSGIRIGIPSGCADSLSQAAELFASGGALVETFDLPLLEYVPSVAYIICCAETSNSISRFDGLKFGYRAEHFANLEQLYVNTRTEAFTLETKVLALMGMQVLTKEKYEKYFNKALRVRRLIKEGVEKALAQCDCLLLPVGRYGSEAQGDFLRFKTAYEDLKYTALPHLAGFPALTAPQCGGFSLIAGAFEENLLFTIADALSTAERKEAEG